MSFRYKGKPKTCSGIERVPKKHVIKFRRIKQLKPIKPPSKKKIAEFWANQKEIPTPNPDVIEEFKNRTIRDKPTLLEEDKWEEKTDAYGNKSLIYRDDGNTFKQQIQQVYGLKPRKIRHRHASRQYYRVMRAQRFYDRIARKYIRAKNQKVKKHRRGRKHIRSYRRRRYY